MNRSCPIIVQYVQRNFCKTTKLVTKNDLPISLITKHTMVSGDGSLRNIFVRVSKIPVDIKFAVLRVSYPKHYV
jgi:ribosomal protein RSM22 (predicted rRNA methylase)